MYERSTARAALISILPALALLACTGSADNGKAGGTGGSTGGTGGVVTKKDGGTAGTGGSGGGGAGGTGGPSTGGSPIKFCNALALAGNANLRLLLKIGEPPKVLTADSGMCSTEPGTACMTIAPGMYPVAVTDDQDQPVASGTMTIGASMEYLVMATLDMTTMKPLVRVGALRPGFTCATLDPFMPSTADGGTNPGPADAGAGN